jgi:phosphoribulokinase/uridine kinase family protein
MSRKHPIVSVTGSSGAGTTSVMRIFAQIFRREGVKVAFVEGDSFHRYDRVEMAAAMGEARDRGDHAFSHFGPEANLFDELEELFRVYGETGTGKFRKYLHDDDEAKPYGQQPGTFTPPVLRRSPRFECAQRRHPRPRPARRERDTEAAGAEQFAGPVLREPGPAQRVPLGGDRGNGLFNGPVGADSQQSRPVAETAAPAAGPRRIAPAHAANVRCLPDHRGGGFSGRPFGLFGASLRCAPHLCVAGLSGAVERSR